MESQIQRMKSSIANIQQNLRKLETENQETTKFHENDENILPQSLIHEDVMVRPSPSPKITQSRPNIIHTDIYTPARHHLDDSEMKKALQHSEAGYRLKKSKSQSIKTQYLYDGARVIYVPPTPNDYTDYGQIVIKTKKSMSNSKDSSLQSNKGKKTTLKFEHKNVEEHNLMGSTRTKNAQKTKQTNKKPKRYRVSEHQPINIEKGAFTQYEIQQPIKKIEKKQPRQKILKSCKTQCNLKRIRIKDPFVVGFAAQTDSEFSEMEI